MILLRQPSPPPEIVSGVVVLPQLICTRSDEADHTRWGPAPIPHGAGRPSVTQRLAFSGVGVLAVLVITANSNYT